MKRLRSRLFLFACASIVQGAIWRSPSVAGQGEVCETPGACVYTITCSGPEGARTGSIADIQAAVSAAHRGDTVKLEAGCTWSTSAQNAIKLDYPKGTEGYVTITTTEDDKLPNPGTRITPAYMPLLPRLVLTGGTGAFFHLGSAHEGSPNRTPGTPAKHWRFSGLAFVIDTNYWAGGDVTRGVIGSTDAFIWSGNGTGLAGLNVAGGVATMNTSLTHKLEPGDAFGLYGTSHEGLHGVRTVTSVSDARTFTFAAPGVPDGAYMSPTVYAEAPPTEDYIPDDIVIDRIVVTQANFMGIVRRTMNLHAKRAVIRDSFLEGAQHNGSDSQTIASVHGSGPYLIENNYIGSASENIMFGGSVQTINKPNTDSVIRFNYLPHPPERYWTLRWRFLREPGIGKGGLVFKGRLVRPNVGTSVYIATNTGWIGEGEPDWSQCQTGTSCTVQDGQVTWRRFGTAHWVIKNNFEMKSARGLLVSHNVLEYMWNGGQESAINIKSETQTKFPSYMNNCIPTLIGRVNTNGSKVTRVSGVLPHFTYVGGDAYGVSGTQITINGVGYTIASFDSSDELTLTGDAGMQTDVPSHFGAPVTSPCIPDWNHSLQFVNNLVRHTSRPLKFGPGRYALKEMTTGLTIRNNLMTGTDAVYWHNQDGTPYSSGNPRSYVGGSLLENTVFEHNTFDGVNAVTSIILGDNKTGSGAVFRYNIFPAGMNINVQTAQYQPGGGGNKSNHDAVVRDFCDNQKPCPVERWDRNIFAGGNVSSFSGSPGLVWNLCGSIDPFLPGACGNGSANWEFLFQDRGRGRYRVKNEAESFKRASSFGQDIGADVSQLAEINDLEVKPTDRMVLFTWQVTEPMSHIPCVIELNTSPDMDPATYAGELSQIGAWFRHDADDHDRNVRSGLSRMALVGHSVNLAPETWYYYRLQCGGDTRTGSFPTLATRTEASERIITDTVHAAEAVTVEVEYGTSYSRRADQIGDAAVAVATCATGQECPVAITVPAGGVVYYRWKEKNAAGEVLRAAEPRVIAGE